MRPDMVPGATFPDYELPDHTSTPRRLSELQGEDPLDPHARARPLLPQGAPAASGAGRVLPQDRRGVHPDRHDRDRRPPHAPGVPGVGRRPVDLPLRPGPNGAAGPRHPGVHRPRARPDDPAHARAQAGPRDPPHLQRLLVLGPAVGRRPLARPAGGDEPDPTRLGPEHARTPRALGRGRLVAVPRVEQAGRSRNRPGVDERRNR